MAVDHYNTLGVVPAASSAELRAAYLKLAQANHPDKFGGTDRERAEMRMQQINEAWNVLGVAHKRREYDAKLPNEPRARSTGQSRQRASQPGADGMRGHAHFRPFDDDVSSQADIDHDARPIAGSKAVPRWVTLTPVALFVFGFVLMGFATLVGARSLFALSILALGFGAVCFLMLPLFVMSRAERDPDL